MRDANNEGCRLDAVRTGLPRRGAAHVLRGDGLPGLPLKCPHGSGDPGACRQCVAAAVAGAAFNHKPVKGEEYGG